MAISADTKNLKNVYLLFGEERYLVSENEKKIAEAVVADNGFAEMNRSVYTDNAPVSMIMDDCGTLPFMADKKLVLIRGSKLFYPGRKDDSEAMNDYLSQLPETTVLVFNEDKVDKRSTLYKTVKKMGECLEFSFMKEKELAAFVKSKCKTGIDCPEYFISVIGTDMERLLGELKKAEEYTGGRPITKDDVDAVCSKSLDTYIFDMTKAVGRHDAAEALEIYGNMLAAKESPVGIMNMLARNFRSMLECKHLSGKGKSIDEIAQALSLRDWQAKNYVMQAKNFSNGELLGGLNACYKCDADFKAGKISDVLGVELVIIEMSKGRR